MKFLVFSFLVLFATAAFADINCTASLGDGSSEKNAKLLKVSDDGSHSYYEAQISNFKFSTIYHSPSNSVLLSIENTVSGQVDEAEGLLEGTSPYSMLGVTEEGTYLLLCKK